MSAASSDLHGAGGPLAVADLREKNPLALAFIDAAAELGYPRNADFNGAEQEGAGLYQTTSRGGWRMSAYKAYIKPNIGRPNLLVVPDAHSTGLVMEGRRCAGVAIQRRGAALTVMATREVILCGGAIASPHLLLLSGIGPAEHLQEMGVPVVHALRDVGRNLQDHFQARPSWRVTQPVSLNTQRHSLLGQVKMGLEFALRRTGPLTVSAGTAGLFAKVLPGSETPDVQYHFLPFSTDKTMMELHDFPGLTISACQLRPESRGTITLGSRDPREKARIHANYLSTETDRRCMVEGVKLARRLAATQAMQPWIAGEVNPGEAHRVRRRGAGLDPPQRRHDLPPLRHLPHGRRSGERGRSGAARARHRGAAHRRCLRHADGRLRQHQRAGHHDRREMRGHGEGGGEAEAGGVMHRGEGEAAA